MSRPYHWFQGTSVETLVERLIDADPATARLEVHQEGDKMTFRVVPAEPGTLDEEKQRLSTADINDSFICPPRCP